MDCTLTFAAFEEKSSDYAAMKFVIEEKINKHQSGKLFMANREEFLICPAPRRVSSRPPHCVDNIARLSSKPKSLSVHGRDPALEVLNKILNKEEIDDDSDSSNNFIDFFRGSPPVRTNNPLIHDVQFSKQASPFDTAAANLPVSPMGGKPLGGAERVPSCGASSSFVAKPKPVVRIEGFACANNKSRCFVSARA